MQETNSGPDMFNLENVSVKDEFKKTGINSAQNQSLKAELVYEKEESKKRKLATGNYGNLLKY